MRSILNFFAFSFKRSLVSLAMFIVIPLCIPYVVYGVTTIFADAAGGVTLEDF